MGTGGWGAEKAEYSTKLRGNRTKNQKILCTHNFTVNLLAPRLFLPLGDSKTACLPLSTSLFPTLLFKKCISKISKFCLQPHRQAYCSLHFNKTLPMNVGCAVVRLRALVVWQSPRLISNLPIGE
jgi:hypothetical protein